MSHNLNILHQNIAGLFSKIDILNLTINELKEINKEIDILCFSETFIKSGDETNIRLHGYVLASQFCRKSTRRGGVCILTKKGIAFKDLILGKEFSEEEDFECCGIELVTHNIIIVCIYRTPTSNITVFFNKLEIILNKYTKNKKNKVILIGDFNIDTLKINKISQELQGIMDNYKLNLHIKEPTRLSSCIDHIASNINDADAELLNLYLSDHNTAQKLSINVAKKELLLTHWYIWKRDINNENISKFKECIKQLSFSDVYMETNVNKAFNIFHDTIIMYYKLCFPKIKIKLNNKINEVKWFTKGLKKSCITKRKLRYQYYKDKLTETKIKYKTYTKLLKKCIKKSQQENNKVYLQKAKNKCKAAWDIIKDKTNCFREGCSINNIVINNTSYNNANDIANKFNNYYTQLAVNDTENKDHIKQITTNNINHTLYLLPCGPDEIIKIVRSLNNTNAVGYDELMTKIIKTVVTELAEVLSFLINLSIEQGCFPDRLKLSIVKPIHKKGKKDEIGNYRPITLIPIISKIFEKVIHIRIMKFLVKFNIIKEEQNGFQKNKSTTLAGFNLIKKTIEYINNKNPTVVLFFDMTKAFDFVSHKILLHKLSCYGIRGPVLEWIKSYISDRKQCVEITRINDELIENKHRSNYIVNRYGVPQGSVLGPLLFLLYINDLPNILKHKCILFADDISIVIEKCNESYENKINDTIKSVVLWLEDNNLQVNLNKTKYMQFYNKCGKKIKLNIKYNEIEIEESHTIKFLGILLDSHCDWTAHVDMVCNKLNRFVYALRRLRATASRQTALIAYHGYVSSVLRYGLTLWGNSTDINRAFITQKKCIRAICGAAPRDSCKPLFKELGVLSLPSLYVYEVACFVKLHLNLFKTAKDIYPRCTRHGNRLVLDITPKCKIFKTNCYYLAIKIFNYIPNNIKELPYKLFKKTLFQWVQEKCLYSLNELFSNNNIN